MVSEVFTSFAPAGEDVVVWRALGDVAAGRFVDSGSEATAGITRALADRGWTRVHVDTPGEPVHLLVCGSPDVLRQDLGDLDATPWVVVVAAPAGPDRPAPPAAAGYRHCLFTGSSDVLVSEEHRELAPKLSYPACGHDSYQRAEDRQRAADLETWRARALEGWDGRAASPQQAGAHQELIAMRRSVSWRVTKPLRAVRLRLPAAPR
jgi:hypothetical protein